MRVKEKPSPVLLCPGGREGGREGGRGGESFTEEGVC